MTIPNAKNTMRSRAQLLEVKERGVRNATTERRSLPHSLVGRAWGRNILAEKTWGLLGPREQVPRGPLQLLVPSILTKQTIASTVPNQRCQVGKTFVWRLLLCQMPCESQLIPLTMHLYLETDRYGVMLSPGCSSGN